MSTALRKCIVFLPVAHRSSNTWGGGGGGGGAYIHKFFSRIES